MADLSGVTFFFEYSMEFGLGVGDIWPDGDAPENPSIEDVEALIEKDGGKSRIFRLWEFDNDVADSLELRRFPPYVPTPPPIPPQEEVLFEAPE